MIKTFRAPIATTKVFRGGAPTLLTVLLAGCATAPTYYHAGKSQADFERDKYDCEQDAYQRAANVGAPSNPILVADYMRDCMLRKHGYTVGPPAPAQ